MPTFGKGGHIGPPLQPHNAFIETSVEADLCVFHLGARGRSRFIIFKGSQE